MSSADYLYSDTEEALRDSVRRLFADRCPQDSALGVSDGTGEDFSAVWTDLAGQLGVAGLLVPESLGGAGASAREAAVVLEEIGRAVAPVPFLSSAVLATTALIQAGDTETVRALADGSMTAALALPLSATPEEVRAEVQVNSSVLTGRVTSVAGAVEADILVVPVRGTEGLELHTVATRAIGVHVTPVLALDMTRPLADVEFTGAASTRVGSGDATGAVSAALDLGAALLSSEQFGVAQWCLDTTLGYVQECTRSGCVIGSYQALKRRLADLWFDVSSAGATARYAADTAACGDEVAPIAATVAQAYCSDVAVRAAEECTQLHGGIGMTWEYPAHVYLKRAKSDQLAFGTAYRHRDRLVELVELPMS